MKILIVNKFLHQKGGAETYVFKTGKQLALLGNDVEYFGMEHEGRIVGNSAEQYTKELDFHGGSIGRLLYPFKIIYSFEAKRKIIKVLESFMPDIVHLNNFNYQLTPSIIYAVRKYEKKASKKIKIVYTAHDYQLVCPNHMMHIPSKNINCEACAGGKYGQCIKNNCIHNSRLRSVLGYIEGRYYHSRNTYREIDYVVCPSSFMETKINLNPVFTGKTATMLNFVDKAPEKATALSEYGEYVLYFGRYSPEKGISTLVEACKRLPHINFVFAGGGESEELFKDVKNIKNIGFVSGVKLEILIRNAKFSVCPSEWYENCPFSVIESIMYSTPVIGARIGGIPELIEDGKTGLLFESGNLNDLCEKISTLNNDNELLYRMTENCGKKQFESVESYTEKLLNLFKSL